MAINLDLNLLDELGLGALPESEKTNLLNHIYETLEMRVGMRLADQMSNEQLEEFEKYFEAKDDAGAFHWLETNFPNYKEIVQDEFNKLKDEVKQSAPQILQAALNQAQPVAPTTMPTQPNPAQPLSQNQQQPYGAPQQYPNQSPYNNNYQLPPQQNPPQNPPYQPPNQPGQ